MSEWFCIQDRDRVSFFPVYLICEVMTGEFKEIASTPYHKILCIFRGSHAQYCLQTEPWKKLQEACLQKILEKPSLSKDLLNAFRSKAPDFLDFVKKIGREDLSRKSNAALWKYYERYYRTYRSIGMLGEPFPLAVKDYLAHYLEQYLKPLLSKRGLEEKFSEYFSVLVSPTIPSFATREEKELVRMAVRARKLGLNAVKKGIRLHAKRFFWVPYDYEGDVWDERYFSTVLQEMAKKQGLEKSLKKLDNQFVELKKRQRKICQEIGVDSYHRQLFQSIRDCSEAMDYKKEVFTQSHWNKNSLMKEIAKRLGVPYAHTYFLLPKEIRDALLRQKMDKELWKERATFCAVVCEKGKTTIEVGEPARAWSQKLVEENVSNNVKELHGVCACPGSAIGKARVLLSAKQVGEMMEGEILVAQATTPDFVPAMKKAKAIVTNEGGITTHAAIVSRELGIPCVVGVPNATKLIQTGELIELHAASGTIKKLEKPGR